MPLPPYALCLFLVISLLVCIFIMLRSHNRHRDMIAEYKQLKQDNHSLADQLSRSKKAYEDLKKESKDTLDRKNAIIDELHMKMFDYQHTKKTAEEMDSDEKPREALKQLNEDYSILSDDHEKLMVEHSELKKELEALKSNGAIPEDMDQHVDLDYGLDQIEFILERINYLEDQLSKILKKSENDFAWLDHMRISDKREETWKGMSNKWRGTLSPHQRAQIHFPDVDPDCLFYLPDHSTFHAVPWCYTLDHSGNCKTITLNEALSKHMRPCSKCVRDEYYQKSGG